MHDAEERNRPAAGQRAVRLAHVEVHVRKLFAAVAVIASDALTPGVADEARLADAPSSPPQQRRPGQSRVTEPFSTRYNPRAPLFGATLKRPPTCESATTASASSWSH